MLRVFWYSKHSQCWQYQRTDYCQYYSWQCPQYRTLTCSKYSSIPRYWTPKYCGYGSIRSTESRNTASTRSIRQYMQLKYCEYTK